MKELIGWGSAFVLIPTFGLQTYLQWKHRDKPAPASAEWFFILALIGTLGQVASSWTLNNCVYFILNVCLVVTNGIGLGIAIHRRTLQPASEPSQ